MISHIYTYITYSCNCNYTYRNLTAALLAKLWNADITRRTFPGRSPDRNDEV